MYYLYFDRVEVRCCRSKMLSPNYYLHFAAYFLFVHCSLPCPVPTKDPGHKEVAHNDFVTISSSAASMNSTV